MDAEKRQPPVTADASNIFNRCDQNKKILQIYNNEPQNAYGVKHEQLGGIFRRQRVLTKFVKGRNINQKQLSPDDERKQATPEKDVTIKHDASVISRTQSLDVNNEQPHEMQKVRIIDGKDRVLKPYLNSIDHMSKQVQNLKFKNMKLRQSLQSTPTKSRFKSIDHKSEAADGEPPHSILKS